MGFSGSGGGSSSALKAYQFAPETYGAKGDGRVTGDVTSNSTTTFTSPTIAADPLAPGKWVQIHGANGVNGGPVIGQVVSASPGFNTFVLTVAAGASVASCPAVWGSDDTTPINSALAAGGAYATAGNYFTEIVFGNKVYILASGPTQTQSPGVQQNSQLVLPYPNINGTTPKMILQLTGAGDAGYPQYWEALIPNLTGTCLISMLTPTSGQANSATFGLQSVLGGPSAGGVFTGGYANDKVVIKGISIWCPLYTNMIAYDLGYVAAIRVQQSSAHTFAPPGVNVSAVQPYQNNITSPTFTNSIGRGFRTPVTGNNNDIVMDDVTVQGYENAFWVFDHLVAGRLCANYSDVALFWNGGIGASGTMHGLFIQSMSAENYNGGFRVINATAAQVEINWDCENSGAPAYDISDGGNALYGLFKFGDKIDNRAPAVVGASNLHIVNANLPNGHWAGAPAVPASGTAQQNTAWKNASIVVHCGAGVTVSAINIDGTVTGLTIAAATSLLCPVLPGGKNITLTYAGGTPTWDWWLDE